MSAATEGFVHPEYLIETEALAAKLGDPNLDRARQHDASDPRPEDHLHREAGPRGF